MKKMLAAVSAVWLWACIAAAQNSNTGTVNSMSTDPEQNQKLTGTMGTTTGQPNDVTPKSAQNPNGKVPMTQTMTGSDSNGDLNQKVGSNRASAKPARPNPAAASRAGSEKPRTKATTPQSKETQR